MKGTIVGSYRIIDTISAGGMGTVYRAEHTLIGRLAAVKILHPELCANHDIINRFFNEARTTTSIKHPGIVEVFDFGYMPSGHAYLIMEFLEGMPLSHRLAARGPIPEGEAALLLRGVCVALSAAHEKGVVHRDLKPDNIFVLPDPDSVLGERTKILDFGIAKLTDVGLAGPATRTGAVMGTPTYMSPEQCRGTGDVDHRADLYSIGCMFYELVAGRPPFVRNGAGELIGSHLFVDPEPPSRHIAGLSPETENLIMTLLAKQPAQRVQSAKELAQRLAVIARQHGWAALGDISRPAMNQVAVPPASPYPGASATPVSTLVATPAALDATTLTPPVIVPPPPPAPARAALKPTTLSAAASQVAEPPPPRPRRRLGLAIAGGLLAAAGGIGAVVAFSGSSSPQATRSEPAARPAPAPLERPPVVAPPPATPAPVAPPRATDPAPAAVAPPRAADPAPAPVAPPRAADPAPTPVAPPPPATPATRSPATRSSPATPPITAKPAAKPAPKPAPNPPKRPRRAGSANSSQDLLEQDI